MTGKSVASRATIVFTLLVGAVIAASDPVATARSEFMQAYAQATATGVVVSGNQDSATLQAYVLYPYLQAARLRRALIQTNRGATLDQDIKAFIAAQNGAPVINELRRAWLLDLAARRQWTDFQANMLTNTADVELRCLAIAAQLASTDPAVEPTVSAAALRSLWLSANRLPGACNVPFDWARGRQVIDANLIEQRARLTLQSGNVVLARELADMLPAAQAQPIKQWAALIEKPQQSIDELLANSNIKVEPAALLDGWQRLARKDQDAAIARLPRLMRARGLNEAAASPYALSLALALSWSRRDETLQYFTRVSANDLNEQAHEWRVRAMLWAARSDADWTRVQETIAALPVALRTQARWRYWQARAAEQLKDTLAARTLYESLVANDDNYYAALAAARLQVGYVPHPQVLPADDAAEQALAKQPGMQRARELLAVSLRNEATAEWNRVFATLQPGEHVTAARLAHDWGWYDQAVGVTAKLGLYNDYEFLYPRPYDSEVAAAAKLSGLPSDLIYSVMRQETLFRADAVSTANARGLLQLILETARTTARKYKLPAPSSEDLFKPAVNVPIGAAHLKDMINGYNGQKEMALAAYNAGPGAARRWLPSRPMDMDIWVENIPYNETRTYVQRVLWYSLVFHWLRDNKPVDTQDWLSQVRPAAQ
ncbi:MAG: transglycosylase SLT domain-containing protein [Steroidobacteraceae bacterium]